MASLATITSSFPRLNSFACSDLVSGGNAPYATAHRNPVRFSISRFNAKMPEREKATIQSPFSIFPRVVVQRLVGDAERRKPVVTMNGQVVAARRCDVSRSTESPTPLRTDAAPSPAVLAPRSSRHIRAANRRSSEFSSITPTSTDRVVDTISTVQLIRPASASTVLFFFTRDQVAPREQQHREIRYRC